MSIELVMHNIRKRCMDDTEELGGYFKNQDFFIKKHISKQAAF